MPPKLYYASQQAILAFSFLFLVLIRYGYTRQNWQRETFECVSSSTFLRSLQCSRLQDAGNPLQALRGPLAQLAPKVPPDHKGRKDHKDHKDHKDRKDQLDLPDLPGRRANPVQDRRCALSPVRGLLAAGTMKPWSLWCVRAERWTAQNAPARISRPLGFVCASDFEFGGSHDR